MKRFYLSIVGVAFVAVLGRCGRVPPNL